MTFYDARQEIDKSAWRLAVDLVKLEALADAKLPLDAEIKEYTAHLALHRALLYETERLMQPAITKQLPYRTVKESRP
jgi:hypothetical protein